MIDLALLLALGLPTGESAPRAGTCGACHSMAAQVQSWSRSPHAKVARCEDCHLPQHSFLARNLASLADGLRHAAIQGLRGTPALMRVREGGARTLQANCLRCHGPAGGPAQTRTPITPKDSAHLDPSRACAECHRDSPHGPLSARHGA